MEHCDATAVLGRHRLVARCFSCGWCERADDWKGDLPPLCPACELGPMEIIAPGAFALRQRCTNCAETELYAHGQSPREFCVTCGSREIDQTELRSRFITAACDTCGYGEEIDDWMDSAEPVQSWSCPACPDGVVRPRRHA